MTKTQAATTTTWGALTDDEVGRTVRLVFPWASEPTEAVLRDTSDQLAGYADDPGWQAPEPTDEQLADPAWTPATAPRVRARRHVLDYGGSAGEQETQLADSTPVELLETTPKGTRTR